MPRRITLNIALPFIVEDDEAPRYEVTSELERIVGRQLRLDNSDGALDGLQTIVYSAPTITENVAWNICRIDGAKFYAPWHFPIDRALPDICPQHAAEAEQNFWDRTFAEPMELLRTRGYDPAIVNTGGGCMNLQFEIKNVDGIDRDCYLGFGDPDDGPLLDHLPLNGWGGCVYIDQGDGYPEALDYTSETDGDLLKLVDTLLTEARTYCAENPKAV